VAQIHAASQSHLKLRISRETLGPDRGDCLFHALSRKESFLMATIFLIVNTQGTSPSESNLPAKLAHLNRASLVSLETPPQDMQKKPAPNCNRNGNLFPALHAGVAIF
jgi:hypothetical protein